MSSSDHSATLAHEISVGIQKLNQYVQSLNVHVERIGSAADTDANKRALSDVIQSSNALAKSTSNKLQELGRLALNDRSLGVQRERLMNECMTVLNRLQAVQRRAAAKEKSQIKSVTVQDEALASRYGDESMGIQLQQQHRSNLAEIRERQAALSQLESDISDVNQIFKDLAVLVHSQGEMVDSIEANIESATIHVTQASVNVNRALEYQRSARQKKLLLLAFFVLLALIILLVVYLWAR